ncbi:DUF4214 domain-containing protein [Pseudosulfitobacter sp. DSM 107133]|uniref:DUF4214 domain-containing protein n=1 Tax=Pseudosulfitobacter sp. DSM 107133 TaxID=2883100 RepID=UPI0013B38E65|nr:DUF4214 domain-containing protein [Pseudosulfitobacter sp. DSM 107133]UOA29062.1 Serralysin B [Pseudosulfitobacter sp. DSM 107133]
MAYLTHVGTRAGGSDAFVSGISDLVSFTCNYGARVATISADGQWIEIRKPDTDFSLLHRVFVDSGDGLTAPGRLELGLHDGALALLSFGPQGVAMTAHVLNSHGRVAQSVSLPTDATRITCFERIEAAGGKVLVFTAGQDRDGVTCWQERADGSWEFEATLDLGASAGARDVADMAQVAAHGATWLLTLSAQSNAVHLLQVSAGGQVQLTHCLDAQSGLPVANPTAVEVVQTGGRTFVLMAGAGTSSISVMQLEATGKLTLVDQVNDDMNTRFQALTQLEVIETDGRVFIVAGGGDDGLSLLTLLPDGRLVHLDTIADSMDMALEDVTGLSMLLENGVLRIFASGEGGLRVSELAVDLGNLGSVVTATASNANRTGTNGDDILQGNGADNVLDGRGGDDILTDGRGADRLTGGEGADTFIFRADGSRDIITDFQLGVDTIDLSGMGRAYSLDAFRFQSTSNGIKIFFQGEELHLFSDDGRSLKQSDFHLTDLMGLWHIDTAPLTPQAQRLIGTGGDDVLVGGTGDDMLRGEAVDARFDDPAGQVFRLYRATLDRDPDETGHKSWTTALADGSQSLLDVISGFVGSAEFQRTYGATTDEGFVTLLYNNVLDRAPDAAGLAAWTGHLGDGTLNRAEVVRGFSESGEFKAATEADSLRMSFAGYQAALVDDVFRLYRATLDRDPDEAGLLGWSERMAGDWSYAQVAAGFVNSAEFQNTYGDTNDRQFVTLLYNNVLDRAPDSAGLNSWLALLRDGTYSRPDVVRGFAQSAELIKGTADALTEYLRNLGENDRLEAGGGHDVLYGGALSDTFVFAAFDGGAHVVVDLEAWDRIELQGFGYGSENAALAQFEQVGSNVVFEDQEVRVTFLDSQLVDVSQEMLVLL